MCLTLCTCILPLTQTGLLFIVLGLAEELKGMMYQSGIPLFWQSQPNCFAAWKPRWLVQDHTGALWGNQESRPLQFYSVTIINVQGLRLGPSSPTTHSLGEYMDQCRLQSRDLPWAGGQWQALGGNQWDGNCASQSCWAGGDIGLQYGSSSGEKAFLLHCHCIYNGSSRTLLGGEWLTLYVLRNGVFYSPLWWICHLLCRQNHWHSAELGDQHFFVELLKFEFEEA